MPVFATAPLTLLLALLLVAAPVEVANAAGGDGIEGYASYEPQTTCHPKPRPGTKVLGAWLVKRLGGGGGATGRACGGGASEHKDGRAIDWTLDAGTKSGRVAARKFLARILKTDKAGREHAKARRMGIMYVIWKDRVYSAWDRFEPKPYLSSSCPNRKKCSKTLRHRDHMHISLSMAGAKGRTSWYERRLSRN
ncbi:hypothetical protein [Nocardioides sp.]|uniref:hypothetical protein n=1 Tax=Nocardioides sp. TaxID=35761 RepID=UPI0035631E55